MAWSRPALLALGLSLAVAACRGAGASEPIGSSGTPPAGFPVGSWVTSISTADLTAGGITDPDLLAQNEGTITLTFRPDGTFQVLQVSTTGVSLREPVLRGRYVVTGNRVRTALEFPTHYADEGVHDVVEWQLDGTLLRLRLIEAGDPIARIVYGAHPWTAAAP